MDMDLDREALAKTLIFIAFLLTPDLIVIRQTHTLMDQWRQSNHHFLKPKLLF